MERRRNFLVRSAVAAAAGSQLKDTSAAKNQDNSQDLLVEKKEVPFDRRELNLSLEKDNQGSSNLVCYESLVHDYTQLRAYKGEAKEVKITKTKIFGYFTNDESDFISQDNGGTIIVGEDGRRWKRVFNGPASASWFGVAGDGRQNDSSAAEKFLSQPQDQFLLDGRIKVKQPIFFGQKTYRFGQSVKWQSTGALLAFNVSANTSISGGSFENLDGVTLDISEKSKNIRLGGLDIWSRSKENGTGININSPESGDIKIFNCNIEANGFGVLLNNKAADFDGLQIISSRITSTAGGDAIEFNSPATNHQNLGVIGNIIRAEGSNPNHTAGFGIGVAGSKNVAIIGNMIAGSVWEAIHVEDAQDTVCVVGNVGKDIKGDFFRISSNSKSDPTGKAMPIIGNNATAHQSSTLNAGAWNVWNENGCIQGLAVVGNRFAGFENGLRLGPRDQIANSNVIDGCRGAGIRVDGQGYVYGENLVLQSRTLIKTSHGSVLGRVMSDNDPDLILDVSAHPKGSIGTLLEKGFVVRGKRNVLEPYEKKLVFLFELPRLMLGRLILRISRRGSSNFIYYSSTVQWNGTILSEKDLMKDVSGRWDALKLTASEKSVKMEIQSSDKESYDFEIDVIFSGEFYKT